MTNIIIDIDRIPDPGVTISLSPQTRTYLEAFSGSTNAPYKDALDALRFAVSIALTLRKDDVPVASEQGGDTVYNMGSFDRDGVFKEAFQLLAPSAYKSTPLARLVRLYGEWGAELMYKLMLENGGEFNILVAIKEAQSKVLNE